VVPTTAVYTDADGSSSVAVVRNGIARRVKVARGLEDGDWVEIAGQGIGVGTVVVTTGSYALEDGTHVRVSRITAPTGRP
jgi:hypothetical protein